MPTDFRRIPVDLQRHNTREMCQPIPVPHTGILGKAVAEWEEEPNTLVHGLHNLAAEEIRIAEEAAKWAGFPSLPVRLAREHFVL